MAKFLLWTITLVGLAPTVFLIIGTAYLGNRLQSSPALSRYRDSSFYIHDTYVSLADGSMNVTVYPRIWVLALIASGIGCVVVGLVFLLHVPLAKS